MTMQQMRAQWCGYWITGSGNFAVVCSSARRVTLFPSLDIAKEAKHAACGRHCDRYNSPHVGYKIDAPPAPEKLSSSWKRMVADA
jgi:hypothetical protein